MTITVRLPHILEENLAQYCVERGINRSEAVKQAITRLVMAERDAPSAYDLGRDLFGPETDRAPAEDVASQTKRLLREKFRPA
ncbi:MAG: hypothetical protein OHM77_05810 [Candidatus Nitricoxidivorans perseverans]|uniref:Ribbon-helix-helix protein, CopG family n=1 Tax=Candidatus Nitricoxidivorans perseverans TaxID=2975601 RepID=A0AA49J048_9PROT|nr:MAG: hypothetical protein OHM77_05810 [Candidatus Nitricoxidivorans perseverans]